MIRIKELRTQKKVSQKELAEYLNVTQVQISKYELGKNEPDLETLSKIAKYFDVTIDYILDKEPNDLIVISKSDFKKLKEASEVIQKIERLTKLKETSNSIISGNTITTNGNVTGDVFIGQNIKDK